MYVQFDLPRFAVNIPPALVGNLPKLAVKIEVENLEQLSQVETAVLDLSLIHI